MIHSRTIRLSKLLLEQLARGGGLPLPAFMAFDPSNPLPRRTLFDIAATGPGQASASRLWASFGVAALAAAGLFLFARYWWLGFWPTCLASFALWGIAAKATHALDVRHAEESTKRLFLRLLRTGAIALGTASLALAVVLLVGTTLEWGWLMDAVGS